MSKVSVGTVIDRPRLHAQREKSSVNEPQEIHQKILPEKPRDKKICFICSGNICRSPMAEGVAGAIAKANRLPLAVSSAGVYALNGSPPSANAAAVLDEIEIDISAHRSKNLWDINPTGALFVCMSREHMLSVAGLGVPPELIVLLGGGVPDPYGGPVNVYRECRDAICEAVTRLISELADEMTPGGKTFVRECIPADAWALAGLETECFPEPWSAKGFLSGAASGNCVFFAAVSGGRVIGYIGMQVTGRTGYITNLCVTERHRRAGVAKKLLSELLIRAAQLGQREVTLEVRPSNTPAIRLYESMGFKQTGLRKNFYRKPDEDALILELKIKD